MIHILSALKSLLKSKNLHIDHWAFRLHYRFTVLFLLLFCIIVSTKQYAGDPIRCSKDTREFSSLVDNYCFITATYTVKTALNLTASEGAPHPGIYPAKTNSNFATTDTTSGLDSSCSFKPSSSTFHTGFGRFLKAENCPLF
ncbi:innexin [Trichonephila clavata]|uniref:Innexin n=1 Tax=Trichonephila clavata TaxID=2740835 RepID=A0A8X6KMJ5_TRICU|nr:innexin [Trichonephila clavata]